MKTIILFTTFILSFSALASDNQVECRGPKSKIKIEISRDPFGYQECEIKSKFGKFSRPIKEDKTVNLDRVISGDSNFSLRINRDTGRGFIHAKLDKHSVKEEVVCDVH